MKTITLLLATVSCCLSAAPVFAAKDTAPVTVTGTRSDDPDTIRVAYGDLSLANAADAAILRARVAQATRRACGALYDSAFVSQRWACLDIARRVAEPQITAAIQRAGTEHNLAGRAVVLRFAGH